MILFDTFDLMNPINPYEVYTTQETRSLLKISKSTIKRLLKRGIIRANKIGGHYRIMGKEILRLIDPDLERAAVRIYQKTKRKIKAW